MGFNGAFSGGRTFFSSSGKETDKQKQFKDDLLKVVNKTQSLPSQGNPPIQTTGANG
jgi:hypothetical protein